jgi:hypothetical protein
MNNYQIMPFTLLSFVVFALVSCKSKSSQPPNNSTQSQDQTKNLIKEFASIINGSWVKKDYIDSVIKTKSTISAIDLAQGLTTISINKDSVRDDSLVIGTGWNNHEGGNGVIKFHSGKKASTILLNGSDLGYEINGKDTLLVLYKMKGNGYLTTKYIKAMTEASEEDLSAGMSYLINKGIIAGTYSVVDKGGYKSVVFDPYGKVIGLSGFKTYSINYDLGIEPMTNLDEISFDTYTKHQASYTFKMIADTLSFYETLPNVDSTKLLVGKLKYKLIRKR